MKNKYMMTENYCDDCDDVLHAVFNINDFYDHKVGRIRCKCGCVVKPCNECEDHDGCGDCPWTKAKIVDVMTDEEYIAWEKANEPKFYKMMKKGDCGIYYKNLVAEIEAKKENESEDKRAEAEELEKVMNKLDWASGRVFGD